MKALRILQIATLLLLVGYLLLLHNENPYYVLLPFVPNLPAAVVVALALILGWLVGWLPAKMQLWRSKRYNEQLARELESMKGDLAGPSTRPAPDSRGKSGSFLGAPRVEPGGKA